MNKSWSVNLTTNELLLLDGQCSSATQRLVDAARATQVVVANSNLTERQAELVINVASEARTNGLLIYRLTMVDRCTVCGKTAGYVKYKSGRNKGQDNYAKPLTMRAIEFADRFIRLSGRVSLGACVECVDVCIPHIKDALIDVRAQIPTQLRHPTAPILQKCRNVECLECGWKGHEGNMRKLPALMGGMYSGGCPQCPAENSLFVTRIKTVDGFVAVETT